MTALQAWKLHPTRRKEFTELLNEPALLDAIAIVKERAYEITLPPTGGTYSLTEFYSLYGAKQMGYLECLQNLLGLANLSPHKVPDRKPWTTVLDKAAEGQPPKPQTE
jgi:hypothetical protein